VWTFLERGRFYAKDVLGAKTFQSADVLTPRTSLEHRRFHSEDVCIVRTSLGQGLNPSSVY